MPARSRSPSTPPRRDGRCHSARGARRRERPPTDPREDDGAADGSSVKSPRQCIGNVDMADLVPVPDTPPTSDVGRMLEKNLMTETEIAALHRMLEDMRSSAVALVGERDQAMRDVVTAREHGVQLQVKLHRTEVEMDINKRDLEQKNDVIQHLNQQGGGVMTRCGELDVQLATINDQLQASNQRIAMLTDEGVQWKKQG